MVRWGLSVTSLLWLGMQNVCADVSELREADGPFANFTRSAGLCEVHTYRCEDCRSGLPKRKSVGLPRARSLGMTHPNRLRLSSTRSAVPAQSQSENAKQQKVRCDCEPVCSSAQALDRDSTASTVTSERRFHIDQPSVHMSRQSLRELCAP
jgi:hypothetical protein